MKKVLLLICLIALVVAAAAGFVLTQKSAAERIVPWWVNRQNMDLRIKDFKIGRQIYDFPDAIRFENVRLTVKQPEQNYTVEMGKVDIRGLFNFLYGDQPVLADVVSFDVRSPELQLAKGLLHLAVKPSAAGEEKVAGHLRISEIRQQDYLLSGVSADISGDLALWRFRNFYAQFYGGLIRGEILLDSKNQMLYSIHMQLEEVDLKQLRRANPEFFSNVKGTVLGTIDLSATPAKVHSINAQFSTARGGEIKASLLNYLLQYIPANSSQRKDLEKLIKSDGNVPLNRADIEIKNLTDEKLSSRIKLLSERFNLDIDVTLDVSVEGGFQNLLNYQKNFIKQLGGTP